MGGEATLDAWVTFFGGATRRIASPAMFPEAEIMPHLICSRPIFIGGANDEVQPVHDRN